MNDNDAYCMTASGKRITFLNPDPRQFDPEDMAASLSRICRFNGHLSKDWEDSIYSVAQHSYYVWKLLNMLGQTRAAHWGLLHDAMEFLYGDTITPLKNLVPILTTMEDDAAARLRSHWGVPYDDKILLQVQAADQVMGCVEAFALKGAAQARAMYGRDMPMFDIRTLDPNFHCWAPSRARRKFLEALEVSEETTLKANLT